MREGFVSAERAREGYGVVLDASGEVDANATAAARDALGRERFRIAVRADETDPYTGVRGRRRTLRLGAMAAERLGVADDDLVELLGAHPAPLRAWVRVDEGEADAATIGLDAFGRRVLGVAEGDEVELRRIARSRPPGGMAHPRE